MKNLILILFIFSFFGCQPKEKAHTLSILQFNIWQEGTVVPGGYDAVVDEIVRLDPDFVTFSEVRNYNDTRFNGRIVKSLAQKGKTYFVFQRRFRPVEPLPHQ